LSLLSYNYVNVLEDEIKIEGKIRKYYIDSTEISKSLMADIRRVFERIAKKREKRKIELESIK